MEAHREWVAIPMTTELLAESRALCPTCLDVFPSRTVERDGKVWLQRTCDTHGFCETLVLSDAEWWKWSRSFVKPGQAPMHRATESEHGCPHDCGLCPDHTQHSCVTVFEITDACNLSCPACFAGEAHTNHRTLDEVRAMADAVLAAEGGEADLVMLSGGEPTVHPRFLEIADLLTELPIRYTVVNTNGVRIARSPELAAEIARRGMLVYLQFDGFESATYETLRGDGSLLDVKLRALENLADAGARVVLVATVVKGVNDHELAEIVRFGADHRAVRSVSLQPQFGEGRYVDFDPADRMTLTDVIESLDRDSDIFSRSDFLPIPCCDPMCTAATYAWIHDGKITPVTQMVPVESYLQYMENTAMPNISEVYERDAAEMREVLLRLYSKSAPAGSDAQADAFMCACEPLLAEMDRVDDLPEQIFAVTIEGFMDRWIFDVERVKQCCISEALPDGRIIPFCAYNTLYRFAPDQRAMPGPVEPHVEVNVQPVTVRSGR